MKKYLKFVSLAAAGVLISSCKGTSSTPINSVPPSSTPDITSTVVPPSSTATSSTPVPVAVTVALSGPSEIKYGGTITLTVEVTGTLNTAVIWSVSTSLLDIDNGVVTVTAKVTADTDVTVTATSVADPTKSATHTVTVKAPPAQPTLTQAMIAAVSDSKIEFNGSDEISLYSITTGKYMSHSSFDVNTYMDTDRWVARYIDSSTGVERTVYYANHNGKSCQVGVSLNNEEEYAPTLDSSGREISWTDSGLYNPFSLLKVSDFVFNEETWMYEYIGSDASVMTKAAAAANPYEFEPKSLSLIIDSGEIIGIKMVSQDDYSIASGYKAIQTLTSTVNYGDVVTVPSITKYQHEEIHDKLQTAIANMQGLTNYKTQVDLLSVMTGSTAYSYSGYVETITPEDCYYQTSSYDSNGNFVSASDTNVFGFHAFGADKYNSYNAATENNEYIKNSYNASRAYTGSLDEVKPSFDFAAEIFTGYHYDQETGETYYYVDSPMSFVATTFYYGVGSDINTYGVFATEGVYSSTSKFTPFVVVKDGYITEACFYFNMGLLQGLVNISFSDYGTAALPEGTTVQFTERTMPTEWSELDIIKLSETAGQPDETVAADVYLKSLFDDETIIDRMPFFGEALGDAYALGMTGYFKPYNLDHYVRCVQFYYDVPLDSDYTISSSLEKVYDYLLSLGFTNNGHNEYVKGDITVAPVDTSLDLFIYVYKTVTK